MAAPLQIAPQTKTSIELPISDGNLISLSAVSTRKQPGNQGAKRVLPVYFYIKWLAFSCRTPVSKYRLRWPNWAGLLRNGLRVWGSEWRREVAKENLENALGSGAGSSEHRNFRLNHVKRKTATRKWTGDHPVPFQWDVSIASETSHTVLSKSQGCALLTSWLRRAEVKMQWFLWQKKN